MKLVVFACVVALAVAAPRPDENAEIVAQERSDNEDGGFVYGFETSNGIIENREGTPGADGQINFGGSYSFPLPDGTIAEFTYVADENGARFESPLLPPLPDFVLEQIAFAEEERDRGIIHEK